MGDGYNIQDGSCSENCVFQSLFIFWDVTLCALGGRYPSNVSFKHAVSSLRAEDEIREPTSTSENLIFNVGFLFSITTRQCCTTNDTALPLQTGVIITFGYGISNIGTCTGVAWQL